MADTLSPYSNALNTRRLSSTSTRSNATSGMLSSSISSQATVKPLIRPQPQPRVRPTSPPASGIKRYPSPPTRPQSVRTTSPNGHPQQHAKHNIASLTQAGPRQEDLIAFAAMCRALYYDKDAGAAQAVDTTLQRLPAPHRTPYARVMASIRSQFHRDEEIRRRKQVEDALEGSKPGHKIMESLKVSEGGTGAMRSSKAVAERRRLLEEFIKGHCLKGLPGTQPFFRGLYALLYLQAMSPAKGGAGRRRVEWEVDVTVFSEAGGGSWLVDSIEILKEVLGCTERIKEQVPSATTTQQSYFDEQPSGADPSSDNEDSESEPLESPAPLTSSQRKKQPPAVPPHRPTGSLRTRSTSDPFLDPGDRKVVNKNPLTPSPPGTPAEEEVETLLPASTSTPSPIRSPPIPSPILDAPPPPQYRIFTLPSYLTDPELSSLCALFPEFITTKVKQSTFKNGTEADIESGRNGEEGSKIGHGEIRIGSAVRDEGWRGSAWQRFVRWLRGIFGRS